MLAVSAFMVAVHERHGCATSILLGASFLGPVGRTIRSKFQFALKGISVPACVRCGGAPAGLRLIPNVRARGSRYIIITEEQGRTMRSQRRQPWRFARSAVLTLLCELIGLLGPSVLLTLLITDTYDEFPMEVR